MKQFVQRLYDLLLRGRRLRKLTGIMLPYLPDKGDILDLGCGNGDFAAALMQQRPGINFTGLDIFPVPHSKIPRFTYDGINIPYPDEHFDYVMLITVLHHTDDYVPVLQEAQRVAKKGLIILDHQYFSRIDWLTLAFIDWPGNVPFGVYTPFNFKTRPEWVELFKQLKLKETLHNDKIYLFGKIFDSLLGKRMHFVSTLEKH